MATSGLHLGQETVKGIYALSLALPAKWLTRCRRHSLISVVQSDYWDDRTLVMAYRLRFCRWAVALRWWPR